MLTTHNDGIAIKGIVSAVPSTKWMNSSFSDHFGTETVEKFTSMVGVHEFRKAVPAQTASDLAYEAAEKLLANTDKESIGALVFVTQTPDYLLPSTAFVIANRLGLSKDCMVFDINLGCSGYVYGLQVVASLMQSSNIEAAVLVTGDTLSKRVSPEDRSACMLFGDAGTATLLVKEAATTPLRGAFRSDGSGYQAIIIPSGGTRNPQGMAERKVWEKDGNVRSDFDLYMNGTDVFSFTITEIPKLMKEYLANANTTIDKYDAVVFHQANVYILKQIARKLKCPADKMPISMDRYGNTSVSSIPLTLCDSYASKNAEKLHLLLCGFGVGLSWGVVDVTIDANAISSIIETDAFFTEGGVSHD